MGWIFAGRTEEGAGHGDHEGGGDADGGRDAADVETRLLQFQVGHAEVERRRRQLRDNKTEKEKQKKKNDRITSVVRHLFSSSQTT